MSFGDDKVAVVCPQCDKRLMVPAGTIGKQGRCPACKNVFTLEQLFEAEPAAAPAGFDAGFGNNNFAFGAPAATATKSAYDDDDFKGDYQLQAAPPAPTPTVTPAQFNQMVTNYNGNYAPRSRDTEGTFWNGSVLGGIAMMLIGAVWLVGGLAVGLIFWYAPVLFIIGLVTTVKGLMSGNLAGE
jgi:hypothetical protein